MLRTLYRGAAVLAAPALRAMLDRRVRRGKEWPDRLGERRGIDATPRPPGRLLWLHAASVGETVSVLPVLAALAQIAPLLTVLITTGTVSSATLLGTRLPELGLEGRVMHRFVPLDVPAWVARFLGHWRPDAAAFVESEIWPNLLAGCAAAHIPTMLLNARLSDRSFSRWQRSGGLARGLFGQFEKVLARDGEDAARLRALGARDVIEAGDLKFAARALPVPRIELERLRRKLDGRPVWLAASTHPGEEAIVVDIHRTLAQRLPRLLTVIAPRHPPRGPEIAALAAWPGDASPAPRRAAGDDPPDRAGIWIADGIGEYGLFFSLAAVCFMGGSLVKLGGHNPLEPARLGCAVAIGPHTANFRDAVTVLQAAGALVQVADAAALADWVAALLHDRGRRQAMGEAGIAASHRYADLPQRVAAMLADLACAAPVATPPGFWRHDGAAWPRLVLAPLAAMTRAATARRVARPGWQAAVPVICCGNAGVGGAGKTTLALDLGRRLGKRGHQVAFLARGFGGHAATALRVLPSHTAAEVGDEALLLAAEAPTYVGADRAASARAAMADGAERLIMDDGLQNPALVKTCSLLVIDGGAGFGNGALLPAGPLREPVAAAMARCAAAVLIGPDFAGALAALPPGAVVLRARLASQFAPALVAGRPLIAFAGIGRPEKFFASLEAAGAVLAARHAFADHHRFTEAELRRLLAEAAQRGAVAVTTPKDAMRLSPPWAGRVVSVGVDLIWDEPALIEALLP